MTRESGTSYLVQFFEDNEYLVINRSRIFREGRLVIDDTASMQWGVNATQSSEGRMSMQHKAVKEECQCKTKQ